MSNIDCSDIENHLIAFILVKITHRQLYPKFQNTSYITFMYSIFIEFFFKVRNPMKVK